MKFKRKILNLIFLSFTILVFSFFSNPEKEKIKLTAAVAKWDTANSVKYVSIQTTLTNISSDTFSYIRMSCYYESGLVINPRNFIMETSDEDCDRNVPEIVRIPPHKNIETIIRVPIKNDISQLDKIKFRIGIHLININNIVGLLSKKNFDNILHYSSSDGGFWREPLKDTSYKISINFEAFNNKSGMHQFDTSALVNFLWSNKIKL